MKHSFSIFNFVWVIGLTLSVASCGNRTVTDVPPIPSSPIPPPGTSPQKSIQVDNNTPVVAEPEICKTGTTSECELAKLQLREVELKQVFDRLIGEIGQVVPFERTQPLTSDISAAQQAWVEYRDKSCDLQVALSQTGPRAIRGSTLIAINAGCKVRMNKERIAELSKLIQEYRGLSSQSPTPNASPAASTSLKVQNLSNGDHYFTAGEAPRYSGEFFLFRKQDNIIIGWGGTHHSDGSCLKKVILSNSQVETTTVTVDPGSGRGEVQVYRDVSIDDGSFGNPELSQVDVNQLSNSAEKLQECAKKFSN